MSRTMNSDPQRIHPGRKTVIAGVLGASILLSAEGCTAEPCEYTGLTGTFVEENDTVWSVTDRVAPELNASQKSRFRVTISELNHGKTEFDPAVDTGITLPYDYTC